MDERKKGIKDGTHAKKARKSLKALKNLRGLKMADSDKEVDRALYADLRDALNTPIGGS